MYKDIFLKDINEYMLKSGLAGTVSVSYSDFEDYQYQTPLALVKKELNKDEFISFLRSKPYYDKVEITGTGFVSVIFGLMEFENEAVPNKKKVVVDYCGVNVAKKMHIGHIRSMFIGDYIVRLHESLGDDVVKVNHIGDWGNQFGYLLNYIQINKLENSLSNESLTKYYKEANKLNDEGEEFKRSSELVAYNLQNNLDHKLTELWKKCVDTSLSEADKIFKKLNVKMELGNTQGESFYAPYCGAIIEDLLKKKIATKTEDGSVVVFFEKLSPLVIQKSNGNFLYAVYDLAAIKWRQENLKPDKIVYVVDKRQDLHFKQVFDVAKRANYVDLNTELEHVGFGTILGKNKKPLKTKEGESLYLDDLLMSGEELLSDSEYFKKIEPEIKETILEKSIIGGLKFYDLKFNKSQDYIFDWSYVLNFSGGSAPYVQNALVRIDSIFYKLGVSIGLQEKIDFNLGWTDEEKKIIFQIQKIKEVISDSVSSYASQTLCENIIGLCQLFHKYYETEQVIGSLDQSKKVKLLQYIYDGLSVGISVLGIDGYPCKQKMMQQIRPKSC